MFKKCKVVMLPTNQKPDVGSIVTRPSDNKMAIVNELTVNDPQPCIHQHLYFLSDEEINVGDWVTNGVEVWQVNSFYGKQSLIKKIIATTDSTLLVGNDENPLNNYFLPQPSKTFIKKYVDEYNKGNVINKVLVEYVPSNIGQKIIQIGAGDEFVTSWKLKINPDNTINHRFLKEHYIETLKDSWTREEVVSLLSKHFVEAGSKIGLGQNVTEFTNKWIEENL